MKILLINPSSYEVYGGLPPSFQTPLGVAYIAAVVERSGYDVGVIDIDAENLTEQQFVKRITEINPAIVGITCTTPVYSSAVRIAEIVKKTSNAITVLGGVHPTILPEESINSESIDIVIKGEGEETFKELVKSIEQNSDLSKVKGLAYKKNGQIINTPQREPIQNLDEIPFPARHLFKTQKYTYPDSLKKKTFPIITSRGCPGRCTFCNTQHIFGHKFRARSAKNVVDEIELLISKYGAEEIHIWDDNFTTDRKRVFEIKDELKRRNIKIKFAFPNGLRADFLNEEILTALKEMGTYSIAIGVESGCQEILDRAKKSVKLEKVKDIIKIAKKLKLETWAFFMFGLPGETKETIHKTIEFAKELDPDIVKFHILKPYPKTEVYHYLLDNGLITSRDYNRYGIHTSPVHKLPGLTEIEMLNLQKKAFKEFYLRPKKVIQQILRIKSFNRLKLNLLTGVAFFKKVVAI